MPKQKRAAAPMHHKRRHGLHQKKTKKFVKVYWPYLPLMLIVLAGMLISFWQPQSGRGILAYATNVSRGGLLDSTNQRRAASGKSGLSLNSKLNQAAQAKANDMANRNYWSHNTPEGQEPWIFIDQAGYAYTKAGENLAYGFASSSDTITGWMNSATHKANMLDGNFQEVGFGYANNPDYQSSGPQTIVVAMYGKPQVAAAVAASPPPPAAQPAPAPAPAPPPATKPISIPDKTAPVPESKPLPAKPTPAPVTTETPVSEPAPQSIARIQTLSGGNAPWSLFAVGLLAGASLMFLILKHLTKLRRLIIHGEQYILHHALLDVTIIALVALCTILTRTTGFIR
jgi:hypothetical protein